MLQLQPVCYGPCHTGRQEIVETLKSATAKRRQNPARPGEQYLIDIMIENEIPEDTICDDIINYFSAGYDITAMCK